MTTRSARFMQQLRRLVVPPRSEGASDAELLDRFVNCRDEAALAALVSRHGPMVLRVCQRVLGNFHDAEDVFQATVLVLARRAGAIRRRNSVAAWLHGVAHRLSRKALASKLRRQQHEVACLVLHPPDPHGDPLAQLTARELVTVVDVELQRLPDVYRLPVILCCLDGRTQDEAARLLGWSPGSVKGRLERGRARLHARLVRRGLTLSAALAAVEAARSTASSAVIAQLLAPTIRGAVAFAALQTATPDGISAEAAALAGNLVKGMALAKLKIATALVLACCVLATGFLTYQSLKSPAAEDSRAASSPGPSRGTATPTAVLAPLALRLRAPHEDANAPIEVRGRVLDPAGNPLAGATLYVGYSIRRFLSDREALHTTYRPRATSGADGRFHFVFTTAELDAKWLDGWRPAVLAAAANYGPDWAEVGESGHGAELNLKLVEDMPLNGRILDTNHQPVAGAQIRVRAVIRDSAAAMTRFLQGGTNTWHWYPSSWRGPLPGQAPTVTTDADGRFRLTGLGRDRIVALAVEGASIQYGLLDAVTRPVAAIPPPRRMNGATFDYVAAPCCSIRGVVGDKATGKPVAGVTMSEQQTIPTALTDKDGRFEIHGCPRLREYLVTAQPNEGQPYFTATTGLSLPSGQDTVTANFDLVTGIILTGRVIDPATQKPPKAAVVEYWPLFPNRHSSRIASPSALPASSASIQADGSYRLAVLPGPGVVCVAASPRNSYAVARVDQQELADLFKDGGTHGSANRLVTAAGPSGQGSLCVNQYNALAFLDPDDRAESLALNLALQPVGGLKGLVVDPDGKPLPGVIVTGLTAMPTEEMLESASFTVRGLNPRRTRDLLFRHREKCLGKLLTIQGDEVEPLTIQLDRWGSINGRLVDRGGKPVPGVTVWFLRHVHGTDTMVNTDRDGRFRACVVPGEKYSLGLMSSSRLLRNVGDLEVESGQNCDLGDLPVGN
jgi:RNA polymerase sigma factor (sigma-70 family)